EEEWIAEPEPGVLITLSTLANGCNRLKKIRFSEEYFDAYGAQRWWGENHDKIMELYTIHQENQPQVPTQSNEEVGANNTKETHNNFDSSSRGSHESIETFQKTEENVSRNSSSSREGSTSNNAENESSENKVREWVVEDEPGVFVTIRSLPNGSKELLRVELSRERFGEVKARVWWEENKARLHKQYS
ncbi:protein Brevis radix-like 2, partial [Asparagus officinalis]